MNTIDNTNAPEKGAKFSVTDSKGTVVDTIVIGDNGVGTSKDLPYGTYTVTQISGQTGTILCNSWTVTISENGKIYEYAKENPLWTAFVSLHKKEAGTETPLIGTFELCERRSDGTVKVLETGTTDADGNLAFSRRIVYTDGICNKSSYFVREKEAPAGYVLDTTEYPVSCTSNGQKITVTIENTPILGKLELRKQSTYGKPMQGVEFLLEFSLDEGKKWTAVSKREDDSVIIPGSCISADLTDGKLLTNADGIAIFGGLRVYTADGKLIRYRVTETKTLNGSTLILGPIWEGDLLTEKEGDGQFEVILGVSNSPILELPETGSKSLTLMSLSILLCIGACLGSIEYLRKKEV